MQPVPSTITKRYPQRGPLQQFRFADSTTFVCFRCGQAKTSRLLAIYCGDWSHKICNGCYGRLLSIYEVKSGTTAESETAEELAKLLLSLTAVEDQRQAERLFRASDSRAANLCSEGLRFIATAEHVAKQLDAEPQLEWSPAVIGLCKAVEAEVVNRLLLPLAANSQGADLSADIKDKDIGRVALFCQEPARKPPELGSFGHFLQTAIHSEHRRTTSPLIRTFFGLASKWTGSQWLLDPSGMHASLGILTSSFRNRAAHIDELDKNDYLACREHVIGIRGLLWEIVVSTNLNR